MDFCQTDEEKMEEEKRSFKRIITAFMFYRYTNFVNIPT